MGRPVSLAAQAGSTIGIPLGGELTDLVGIGYGGALAAGSQQYDDQRGEVVIVLENATTGEKYELVTQVVVNAYPDPGSPAGIDNQVPLVSGFPGGLSQAIALVDIPAATDTPAGPPPGTYTILAKRRIRLSGAEPPVYGPLTPDPGYTTMGYEITILPGAGAPTPLMGGAFGSEYDVSESMRSVIPYPRIVLRLPLASGVNPSAARLIVGYPHEKLMVHTVFENQNLGRGSVVIWKPGPATGQITIDLVNGDPDRSARSIAIAFELLNPFGSGSTGGRASTSDFTVVSVATYDTNGVLASSTPSSVIMQAIR
jgi:hypothetical protein